MHQPSYSNPEYRFEGWKLQKLRQAIKARNLNSFLVPKVDIYRGEKLAECDERLAWLTGFTGSAGFLAVTLEKVALFVDGRYKLEAQETVPDFFEIHTFEKEDIAKWLAESVAGGLVGYCSLFHSVSELKDLKDALSKIEISLIPTDSLIDEIWTDRPPPPIADIYFYPEELAGETHQSKRLRLSQKLKENGVSALLVTNPCSIGWLLNLRGNDIPHTPIFHAHALLYANSDVDLFIDPHKVSQELNLEENRGIKIIPQSTFESFLDRVQGMIQIDPDTIPQRYFDILDKNCEVTFEPDPCLAARAVKNETQIKLCKEVQTRDAVAFVEFLTWFYNQINPTELTEIDLSMKLFEFRQKQSNFKDLSFETIVGSGSNGAIIHYRVKENTNRRLVKDDLILIDSGAQYIEGTTDLTRTLSVGTPNKKQQVDFTLVLRCLIAISQAKWEMGSKGNVVDKIARIPLSEVKEDYDHGTGHGVGQFLAVHEGPYGLSKKNNEPLPNNVILSLEPGLYRAGKYGIRIENLALTKMVNGGSKENQKICFETLTFVPIDLDLILPEQLTKAERAWINRYHSITFSKLNTLVSTQAQDWLKEACRSI